MRLRARTDKSHAAIVKALRQVGCRVSDTSKIGGGFPDLVVRVGVPNMPGCHHLGARVLLMEVKEAKGRLTPDQEEFLRDWPETVIVRSVQEALQAVGVRSL